TYELAYGVWVMSNQALRLGDEALHRACSEEAVDLWRELGNTFYLAHALVGTGGVNMAPHRVERVLNNFRESIRLRREAGERYELSFSLIITGIWLLFLCEFDEAERYIDESFALQDDKRRTPDFAGIA